MRSWIYDYLHENVQNWKLNVQLIRISYNFELIIVPVSCSRCDMQREKYWFWTVSAITALNSIFVGQESGLNNTKQYKRDGEFTRYLTRSPPRQWVQLRTDWLTSTEDRFYLFPMNWWWRFWLKLGCWSNFPVWPMMQSVSVTVTVFQPVIKNHIGNFIFQARLAFSDDFSLHSMPHAIPPLIPVRQDVKIKLNYYIDMILCYDPYEPTY